MKKQNQETKSRNRLIYLLLFSIFIVFGWTYINANQDWGNGAMQYSFLGILAIFGIWFMPKVGINIKGIDNNYFFDTLVGIGLGFVLILLSVLNLVGSFVYGAGLFNIRVFGAGVIETVFFFIIMIPLVNKMFKDSKNIFIYFLICLIVGGIFAFFHFTVVTQGTNDISQVQGFFISATIIAIIWGFALKLTESALPLIISHMMLNFYLVNQTYPWINLGIVNLLPLISHFLALI